MITGAQIRAARKMLGWAPWQVAKRAKIVSPAGVRRAERYETEPPLNSLQLHAIRAALESAGIIFTNGREPGVKLRRTGAQGGTDELNAENDGGVKLKPKGKRAK